MANLPVPPGIGIILSAYTTGSPYKNTGYVSGVHNDRKGRGGEKKRKARTNLIKTYCVRKLSIDST